MVEKSDKFEALFRSAYEAGKAIRSLAARGECIRVVSHHDADGLAAAGILTETLTRMDAYFRVRITKQIDEQLIQELASEGSSPIIFTDLGSGYLGLLKAALSNLEVVILDHHQLSGDTFPKLVQANPHLYGLEGSKEISGAGMAYLTAKSVDRANVDLASLAVIGALGDLQDKNPDRKLFGLNEEIVKDGVDAGCLETDVDLLLYGRETRPVHKALAYTTVPFIPGLSGEEDKCLGFLINLGINLKRDDRWATLSDLTSEDKQRIFSVIAKFLTARGLPGSIPMSLIGTVYTLTREDRLTPLRDAREFSSLLNACGRMDKGGLAVSICIGDRGNALKEAVHLLDDYKKTIAKYMDWLVNTPGAVKELKSIYAVRGGAFIDEKMLSTVTSILATSPLISHDKPIIALTLASNDSLKVSGRMSEALVDKGLNLGSILQTASEKFSGIGGGHNVAAGAQIPSKREEEFLEFVDRVIGDQLGSNDSQNSSKI